MSGLQWHSIQLPDRVIQGHKSLELLDREWRDLDFGDLHGKSFLDIGCWDGYFSFRAEREGAARVVAMDSVAWDAGNTGFDIAHSALNSKVEKLHFDIQSGDISGLGQFDVVLFSGVLYHLTNPFETLRKVRQLTRDVCHIETEACGFPSVSALLWEFHPFDDLCNDPTNWFVPNAAALEGACLAADFSRVQLLNPCNARHYRLKAKAFV